MFFYGDEEELYQELELRLLFYIWDFTSLEERRELIKHVLTCHPFHKAVVDDLWGGMVLDAPCVRTLPFDKAIKELLSLADLESWYQDDNSLHFKKSLFAVYLDTISNLSKTRNDIKSTNTLCEADLPEDLFPLSSILIDIDNLFLITTNRDRSMRVCWRKNDMRLERTTHSANNFNHDCAKGKILPFGSYIKSKNIASNWKIWARHLSSTIFADDSGTVCLNRVPIQTCDENIDHMTIYTTSNIVVAGWSTKSMIYGAWAPVFQSQSTKLSHIRSRIYQSNRLDNSEISELLTEIDLLWEQGNP